MTRLQKLYESKAILNHKKASINYALLNLKISKSDFSQLGEDYSDLIRAFNSLDSKLEEMIKEAEEEKS